MPWFHWIISVALSVTLTLPIVAEEPKKLPIDEKTFALLKIFRDEFIAVTPGKGDFPAKFTMGRGRGGADAERPAHEVAFGYNFWIAKYEVPQNLWTAVMAANPSRWKGARNSVEMFSFDDAVKFCEKITVLLRDAKLIKANQFVRIPSEAEWEYCARAGTTTVYSFGDDVEKLDAYGWHTGNAAGNDPPVGAKKPNDWKLYDVHGYLWEFCTDTWHPDYRGAPTDGSAWTNGGDKKKRVLRGGSWKDKALALTSSYRKGFLATAKGDAIGLRCVLASAPMRP